MKALHIGAGKIGRGFIGAELVKSNYELTFADVNTELVSALNGQKSYTLHIMERDGWREEISNIYAVEIGSEEFFERFTEADIVTTAVSMAVLPKIATTIATFDNALDVGVERYCEWSIDKKQIVGKQPAIACANFTDNLEATIERKLSPALYFAYPVTLALKYSLPTDALATAVAAAMHYRNDDDTESLQLSAMIARYGVAKSAEMVTRVANKDFLRLVEQKYSNF